jgi:hypothetical protein
MLPIVRVLLDRADARRGSLLGLAEVVPVQYWERRVAGDDWSAHHHLAHALSADALVAEAVRSFSAEALTTLVSRRLEALQAALDAPLPALLERALADRARLREALAALGPEALEAEVPLRTDDSWGQTRSLSLLAYLETWAGHDSEHEAAIRAAIAVPPDMAGLARAMQRRR